MITKVLLCLTCCIMLLLPFISYTKSEYHISAVGDIADCNDGMNNHKLTANLVSDNVDYILALGDLVYEEGTIENFNNCFDLYWGEHYDKIQGIVGNHEWRVPNASGYFQYFPHMTNYYSIELGEWLIIVLDSNCKRIGGCGIETEQYKWLQTELQSNDNKCIMAAWHHPVFSSTGHDDAGHEFYKLLYQHNADVVLTGHYHYAEFFKKQDHDGNRKEDGIRQFIVGTGGKELHRIGQSADNVFYFNRHHYGVLNMTLKDNEYSWQFVSTDNKIRNSGNDRCN